MAGPAAAALPEARPAPIRAAGADLAAAGLVAVFLFAFFAPTFPTRFGTTGAIIVNGGLIALIAAVIAGSGARIAFVGRGERTAFQLVAGSLLYYLLAIAFSTAVLSPEVIFADLFELHKPVLHALSLALAFVVLRGGEDVRRLERVLAVCFFGVVAIAAAQLLGGDRIPAAYAERSNIRIGRLSAPFGNPYDFAFALSFFAYLHLFRYLETRRLASLALAAVALALVVLSQSRTNVVVLAGSLALTMPLVLTARNLPALWRLAAPRELLRYGALLLLVGVMAYGVAVRFGDQLLYLIGGIEQLLTRGRQSSLDERIRQFGVVLSLASENGLVALFGNGVSKSVMRLLESGYTFFVFRYGIVGLVVIFLAPLLLACGLLARAVLREGRRPGYLVLAVLVWFISIPVASIGNNFTEQPRLSFLYYFLMGYAIRSCSLAEAEASGAGAEHAGESAERAGAGAERAGEDGEQAAEGPDARGVA